MRDNVDIKLSDATAAELAKRPVEYDAGFTLLPGKYSIKFLARDDETGRIGTYQTEFIIPNLNKEDDARANQLSGAEQPARGHSGCALQHDQGKSRSRMTQRIHWCRKGSS